MRIFSTGREYAEAIEAAETASRHLTFQVDADSIDPAVFGLTSYTSTPARAPRVDRTTAMQVPAVKRTRDLICTASGGLPLYLTAPGGQRVEGWDLFVQPEASVPRSVTMTRLFEDALFEKTAWWKVKSLNAHGFPGKVEWLAPGRAQVNQSNGKVYVDGKETPSKDLIRFDSPNDALLIAGARAIRTCLLLDTAAARHADGTPPLDYFTPGDGMDPATETAEIIEVLNEWHERRKVGYTGYVPAALKYNVAGWSPEQLQLADARQHAVLEIARVAGVDPEELGVSTTSRTYSNQWERRKAFLDFTLGGYLNAIEDRLNMPDVTPEGFTCRFDLDAFLRSDPLARYQAYGAGLAAGAITPEEVRAAEGKPALAAPPAPAHGTGPTNVRALPSPQENAS